MPFGIERRRAAKAARRKKLLAERRMHARTGTRLSPEEQAWHEADALPEPGEADDFVAEDTPGYDPDEAPDPVEWLALDEGERLTLVESYHRRAGIDLPNESLHATFHVVVENQIALGDELPVRRTIERLTAEGLSRHEAVHAVGSVLADQLHDIAQENAPGANPNDALFAAIEKLTAEGWRRKWESDDRSADS